LIELDPLYCDVVIRRWQAFTGKRASRLGDGKRFDDLAFEAANRDNLGKELAA
jgi:hypothetical protein